MLRETISRSVGFVVLALWLAATPAEASNWVQVATTDGGDTVFYVDTESFRAESRFMTNWEKAVYSTDKYRKESKSLIYYDCGGRKSAVKTVVTYMKDGSTRSHTDDFNLSWDPVVPDSVSEALFKFACNARR